MTHKNISDVTKRQFDEALRKEGFLITDFYTNAQYRVFFRRMEHSDSTVTKMRIYYSQDTPIQRGSMLVFKGQTFVVINQDALESEVYFTSVMARCNVPFVIDGVSIPFSMNTPNLTNTGSFIQRISANICVFTGDSTAARKMRVNDEYICGGRTWTTKNTLYIDGLFYALLEITTASQEYHIVWNGGERLDMNQGTTYSDLIVAMSGSAIDPEAVLTYTSSDTSVATISSSGVITLIDTGTVTFTAVWAAHNITENFSIAVVDTSEDPSQQFTCEITYNGLNNNIYVGGSAKKFTATFYDYQSQPAAFQSGGTWSFWFKSLFDSDYSEHNELVTVVDSSTDSSLNENQIKASLSSSATTYEGGNMICKYIAPSGVVGAVTMNVTH